ncbi:antibiotic biosynthesis monooxygenase [Nocardia sp. SYP-A9097]|nr:antibiotic biosynthesis monooxygenase [Nocardia sp. SYP-A9097]
MYALVVTLHLRDTEFARVFDRLALDTADHIAECEPGTLLYVIHTVADAPEVRTIYEVYRDREAFEQHQRQQHTKNFLEQRDNLIVSTKVQVLTPVAYMGFTHHPESAGP